MEMDGWTEHVCPWSGKGAAAMPAPYTIFDCAEQLGELEHRFLFDPQKEIIVIPWLGRSGIHHISFQVEETGQHRTLACVVHGIDASEHLSPATAEAVLALNHSWLLGALGRSPDDGLICYRSALPIDGGTPTLDMLRRVVCTAGACIDEATAVLRAMRYGGVAFEEALSLARESDDQEVQALPTAEAPEEDEGPSDIAL